MSLCHLLNFNTDFLGFSTTSRRCRTEGRDLGAVGGPAEGLPDRLLGHVRRDSRRFHVGGAFLDVGGQKVVRLEVYIMIFASLLQKKSRSFTGLSLPLA